MILANAKIVDDSFMLRKYDLRLEQGKITEIGVGLTGGEVLNCSDKYILPGFIDTHIHGANRARIGEKDWDLSPITRFEATQGVTGIAITTSASEFHSILMQLECAATAAEKQPQGAKILGIHAEGPFINPKRRGAMIEENILLPDVEKLEQLIACGRGYLKMITIAPEIPGASELIKYAVEKGVVVSMGHTDATYEQAILGIQAGATQCTHTFNAMRPLNHREPGVLGAVLLRPEVTCEVICDYVHLHPAAVEMIYRMKGADLIRIISDSEQAAGVDVSEFEVNGIKCYIRDGVVRLEDGTISGSAQTLLDGVRNLLRGGFSIEDIAKMSSYNPAKSLQMENVIGSIAVGKCADLVVLNEQYDVEYTFVNGVCVYRRDTT